MMSLLANVSGGSVGIVIVSAQACVQVRRVVSGEPSFAGSDERDPGIANHLPRLDKRGAVSHES
jgi:hypothetical protein